jgi:hypothetical protein
MSKAHVILVVLALLSPVPASWGKFLSFFYVGRCVVLWSLVQRLLSCAVMGRWHSCSRNPLEQRESKLQRTTTIKEDFALRIREYDRFPTSVVNSSLIGCSQCPFCKSGSNYSSFLRKGRRGGITNLAAVQVEHSWTFSVGYDDNRMKWP